MLPGLGALLGVGFCDHSCQTLLAFPISGQFLIPTDGDVLFLFLPDTSGKLPEPKSEMANDFLCLFQFIYFVNIF